MHQSVKAAFMHPPTAKISNISHPSAVDEDETSEQKNTDESSEDRQASSVSLQAALANVP